MLKLSALAMFSYLLGSLPSAYIAGRVKKSIDIRKAGTGNVGATNALLVIGPAVALLVYMVDLLKGLIPVLLAKQMIGTDLSMGLCGLAAILGHDYSIFLGFSGGKGVATTTGVMFGVNATIMGVIVCAWFLLLVPVTNYFILSSLIAMLMIPILMYLYKLSGTFIVFGSLYFLVGLFTHRDAVVRIFTGREKRAFDSIKKYFSKK